MNPPTNLHAAPGAATTLRKKHFKQRGSVLTELGFLGFFVLTLGVSFHLVSSLGFFGLDSRGTISPDELITANRDGPASFETAEQAHRLDKAEQSPAVADATQLAGLWQAKFSVPRRDYCVFRYDLYLSAVGKYTATMTLYKDKDEKAVELTETVTGSYEVLGSVLRFKAEMTGKMIPNLLPPRAVISWMPDASRDTLLIAAPLPLAGVTIRGVTKTELCQFVRH